MSWTDADELAATRYIDRLTVKIARMETLLCQAVPFIRRLNVQHHEESPDAPSGRWLAAVAAELGERKGHPEAECPCRPEMCPDCIPTEKPKEDQQ